MRYTLFFATLALGTLPGWGQQSLQPFHAQKETIQGVLVDAGCADRSGWNLDLPPEQLTTAQPAQPAPTGPQATKGDEAAQSNGISIDSKTAGTERQDVTMVMSTELAARQTDPTCAIKANTRAFAVLLPNGRLLDLDDGGNTYAALAVQHTPQGRAMINGKGPGFKPKVKVSGEVQGDRMLTQRLSVQ